MALTAVGTGAPVPRVTVLRTDDLPGNEANGAYPRDHLHRRRMAGTLPTAIRTGNVIDDLGVEETVVPISTLISLVTVVVLPLAAVAVVADGIGMSGRIAMIADAGTVGMIGIDGTEKGTGIVGRGAEAGLPLGTGMCIPVDRTDGATTPGSPGERLDTPLFLTNLNTNPAQKA